MNINFLEMILKKKIQKELLVMLSLVGKISQKRSGNSPDLSVGYLSENIT